MVVGMGGVGSVIARKLHEYDCVDRIICTDKDTRFADQLSQRMPRNRFVVCEADAMDTKNLARLMQQHSVRVTCNAAICQTNHSVLSACAEAGSHYLDMAADIYAPPGARRTSKNSYDTEIETFNEAFLDKGIAGILCMGMDPGAVNVFARWAIDRLDTASSIRVLDADNAEVRGYRFAVLFSPETFFEELGAVPYFVKNGKVTAGKPLESEVEWVRFPEPIGLQKTYAVAHEEGVSLGLYPPFVEKGVRYSVFKYSISDKVCHLSKSLALLDLDTWKKVKVDGAEVAPVRVATHALPKPAQLGATVDGYSCVGTEVRGTLGRRRVEYFIYTMDSHRDCYEKFGYSLTLVQTGIPPALTARLLLEGKIPERGVMMPEALDPNELMEHFSREGLPIFVEKRETERI